MRHSVRLVVFDLAGTTVDDGAQVAEAFTTALRPHGVTLGPDAIAGVRGTSKREAISRLLAPGPDHEDRLIEAYSAFRRHLLAAYASTPVTPVHNAIDLFRRLRRGGTRVALNTGFDRTITEAILDQVGWRRETVDAVICGDDVSAGRPAPYMIFRAMELTGITSVHGVMNVGDTVNDLWAGFHAGVHWNVGVLSGAHDEARLVAAPHTAILPSIATIESLFEEASWSRTPNG
jgi:phosphonatase-like hydrolase